jgi:hypothetical protein
MSKRKRQNEEPERKTFHYVDRDVSEPFMIPDSYSQIDPAQMQELQMPEGSLGYTIATGNATGIVVCFEVPPETARPFDDPEELVHYLHETMNENQGIIEAKNGKCKNGGRYVYYIMKYSYGEDQISSRVCGYQLNFNFEIENKVYFISGSFDEGGMTGQRDSIGLMLHAKIKEQAGQAADLTDIMEHDWFCDPYDPGFKKGFLMNRSEASELDSMFPGHPLSVTRSLVNFVVENN